MEKSNAQVPVVVKVLAVFGYISAGILILAALLVFLGSNALISMWGSIGGIAIFIGIFFLILAGLEIFISKGLWEGKNWARITALVFISLSLLASLSTLFKGISSNIVPILIDGFLIYYLGFNQTVKESFS